MSSARAKAETLPSKNLSASDLVIPRHYGDSHMGMHIVNFYCPATFDWMDKPGDRVRAMRKALGMNQEVLAGKLGVDQSTVSDIERGAGFSADILMRLTEHLGGTAALIMQGSDPQVWPFPRVPIARFIALSAEQRAYVEGKLDAAIEAATERRTNADVLQAAKVPQPKGVVRKKSG